MDSKPVDLSANQQLSSPESYVVIEIAPTSVEQLQLDMPEKSQNGDTSSSDGSSYTFVAGIACFVISAVGAGLGSGSAESRLLYYGLMSGGMLFGMYGIFRSATPPALR